MIKMSPTAFMRKLHGLSFAYNRLFEKKSVHSNMVLKDLADFCKIHQTAFHPDARVHALLEGRREVFFRIANHLNLTIEELYEFHKVKEIKAEEE